MKLLHKTLASAAVATITALSIFEAPAMAFKLTDPLNPLKIMPLGDSNTRGAEPGVNSPNRTGYRDDLWALFQDGGFNVDFVGTKKEGPNTVTGTNGTYQFDKDHEGNGGYAIKGSGALGELMPNVDNWLQQTMPDVVLLMAGTNDFLSQNTTAEQTITELGELIDKIFSFSSEVELFIGSLPPFTPTNSQSNPEEAKKYNDLIPTLLASRYQGKNIHFVDTRNTFTAADRRNDGIHLTNQGYKKLADAWFDSILSAAERNNPTDPLPQAVPESNSALSILVLGAFGAVCLLRRKQQPELTASKVD